MKTVLIVLLVSSSFALADPPTKSERTLKHFMVIRTEKLSASQILERFGTPDRDVGSGIFIFEYDLADGSKVRIGTPDKIVLMSATHYDPKTKRSEWICR